MLDSEGEITSDLRWVCMVFPESLELCSGIEIGGQVVESCDLVPPGCQGKVDLR